MYSTFNTMTVCIGFLPAPIAPSQLAARLLAQQKYERIQVSTHIFADFLKYCNISLNYRKKGEMYKKLRWKLKKKQRQRRKI